MGPLSALLLQPPCLSWEGCPSWRTRILGGPGGVCLIPAALYPHHHDVPLSPGFIFRNGSSAHCAALHFCLSGCDSLPCVVLALAEKADFWERSRTMALLGPTPASSCCLSLHTFLTASQPGGLLHTLQGPAQMAPPKKNLLLPPEGYHQALLWAPSLP